MDMKQRFALQKELEKWLDRHEDGTVSYKEKFINDEVLAKRFGIMPNSVGNIRRELFGKIHFEPKSKPGSPSELAELIARLEGFERRLERCERVADELEGGRPIDDGYLPLRGGLRSICGND